jgi:acyl-CoA reductase-like NAD-dependent aldehyde dehydrogenase
MEQSMASLHAANKRFYSSLEGKASIAIYEWADVESAIETVVSGCFYSNGQVKNLLIALLALIQLFKTFNKLLLI